MMMQGADYTLKLKVCLVGDGAVGKTSLVRKYVFDEFSDDYLATIGTKITKREMTVTDPDEDMEIKVDMAIWDIMGQHGFRRLLQEAYFFGVDGVIAVCDLTRKETLDGLNDWLERIEEVAGDVPVITLGNKADLQEGLVVGEEDVERLAKTKNSEYLMTSAKTGGNVERAFIDLTNTILKWRNAKKNERAAALQSQIGAEQPS